MSTEVDSERNFGTFVRTITHLATEVEFLRIFEWTITHLSTEVRSVRSFELTYTHLATVIHSLRSFESCNFDQVSSINITYLTVKIHEYILFYIRVKRLKYVLTPTIFSLCIYNCTLEDCLLKNTFISAISKNTEIYF